MIKGLAGRVIANLLTKNVDAYGPFAAFSYTNYTSRALKFLVPMVNPVSDRLINVPFELPFESLAAPRVRLNNNISNKSKHDIQVVFNRLVAPRLGVLPMDTKLYSRTLWQYMAKLLAAHFNELPIKRFQEYPGIDFQVGIVQITAANPQAARPGCITLICTRHGKRKGVPMRLETELIIRPDEVVLCNWFEKPKGKPAPPSPEHEQWLIDQIYALHSKVTREYLNNIGQ